MYICLFVLFICFVFVVLFCFCNQLCSIWPEMGDLFLGGYGRVFGLSCFSMCVYLFPLCALMFCSFYIPISVYTGRTFDIFVTWQHEIHSCHVIIKMCNVRVAYLMDDLTLNVNMRLIENCRLIKILLLLTTGWSRIRQK